MQTILSNVDTASLEANAIHHEKIFYDKIAVKFDDNSSLLDTFMYHIIDDYVSEWDEKFRDDPEEMLNCYFDGDVSSYVNQLRNDVIHAKNIVVNCYLAYVNIFIDYMNRLYTDNSNMSIEEAIQEIFYSINDEHLIEKPNVDALDALTDHQRQDLSYVLRKVNLD